MKKACYSLIKFFMFLFIVLVMSCREDIVPPNNPAGNINEPVQTHTNNSYTFIINADNISRSVINYLSLHTTTMRIYTSVLDISSGSVQIFLLDSFNNTWYSRTIASETQNSSEELSGNNPRQIQIKMNNFTGKLKVQLFSL